MKDILQPVVRRFLPYAKERMGFDDAPSIYLRTDPKNSESVLAKLHTTILKIKVLFSMFTVDIQKMFFVPCRMSWSIMLKIAGESLTVSRWLESRVMHKKTPI